MTNNVSGASSFELQGNIGKIKTTTTQSNENGKTSVNTEATKVSIFSTLDTDQSKHVSGEEIKDSNSGGFSQFKLNTDAAKKQAFVNLKGSAINIANKKVEDMKNFSTKLDNMLKNFKSSKLFAKLSPDNGQTSVSQSQITTTTQQLDNRANTEFAGHANNVQAKLSDAMAKALAEIANEAKIEGQIQDIANAAKSNVKSTQAEQPKEVKLDGKNNKNNTIKDGALPEIKGNEKVEKSKETKEVKEVKDSKGSNNLTLQKLIGDLGSAVELPIAGRPRGYKAQAWNSMIKAHPELNGKEIQKMITKTNAEAALNRYLAAMEKN